MTAYTSSRPVANAKLPRLSRQDRIELAAGFVAGFGFAWFERERGNGSYGFTRWLAPARESISRLPAVDRRAAIAIGWPEIPVDARRMLFSR